MTTIVEHNVFVDSRQRSIGTSDEFTVWLKRPIVKSHPSHYFTARIVSAEIPYTWRQVNATNNILPLSILHGGNTYQSSLTISPGNYNINQLLSEFKSRLIAAVQLATGQIISVTSVYNSSTNRISIGLGGNPTISITVRFTLNPFLGSMFGCVNDKTLTNVIGLSGDRNVNVNPVTSIYIRSELFRQQDSYESIVDKWDISDILAKIQVMTLPNTLVFYDGNLMLENRIANEVLDRVSVYLSDNQSYGLDLNGNEWSFRISFREVRPLDIETTESYMLSKQIDLKKPLSAARQMKQDDGAEEGDG
jgi:hypothetical protein